MPLKIAPMRSPQASEPSMLRSEASHARPSRRPRSRPSGARSAAAWCRGCGCRASSLRGLEALALVGAAQQAGGAHQLELRLDRRHWSRRPSAFSTSGSLRLVGLLCSACDGFGAQLRRPCENSLSAASAASSSPRMRLLLTTSSASSGSVSFGAGDRVERLVVLDDEDLVAGDLDRVVGHRLDEGRRLARRRWRRPCSSAAMRARSRRRRWPWPRRRSARGRSRQQRSSAAANEEADAHGT